MSKFSKSKVIILTVLQEGVCVTEVAKRSAVSLRWVHMICPTIECVLIIDMATYSKLTGYFTRINLPPTFIYQEAGSQ